MRRRWSSVCKNPDIGMKQEQAAMTLAPWPMVNHMSPSQVEYIVTQKILDLDQASCKYILEQMLKERQMEEKMHSLQVEDRHRLRERLKNSHNQTILVSLSFFIFFLA
jgi:sulfur relay (sulfurtransferase) DsrF/TusC family protein